MRNYLLNGLIVLALAGCDDDDGDANDSTTTTSTTDDSGTTSNATDDSAAETTTTTSAGTESSSGSPTTSESSTGDDPAADTGSTGESTGAVGTTGAQEFTLSSTAFVEGGIIPGVHHIDGGNEHPPLDWVGAPAEAESFAVFFEDVSISWLHSAIWDIPAELSSLPQDVDHEPQPKDVPGAVQCRNWNQQFGYGGPGSSSNFYQFTIYAIDVESISEINQNSSLAEVQAALEDHALATATLQGQSGGANAPG